MECNWGPSGRFLGPLVFHLLSRSVAASSVETKLTRLAIMFLDIGQVALRHDHLTYGYGSVPMKIQFLVE